METVPFFLSTLTKFEDCQAAADAIITEQGGIDILCNNAGIARLAKFLDTSNELRDFQFNVNINGGVELHHGGSPEYDKQ